MQKNTKLLQTNCKGEKKFATVKVLWVPFAVYYFLSCLLQMYTVENFFAPLQLVCKSFVFFCTLLEFFYNYFVLQWSNVWRHILLITLNNIVKEYKIFEKINVFIHPFAKKLQIWWIKSFQKNCILVQKHCKLEQRKCN